MRACATNLYSENSIGEDTLAMLHVPHVDVYTVYVYISENINRP